MFFFFFTTWIKIILKFTYTNLTISYNLTSSPFLVEILINYGLYQSHVRGLGCTTMFQNMTVFQNMVDGEDMINKDIYFWRCHFKRNFRADLKNESKIGTEYVSKHDSVSKYGRWRGYMINKDITFLTASLREKFSSWSKKRVENRYGMTFYFTPRGLQGQKNLDTRDITIWFQSKLDQFLVTDERTDRMIIFEFVKK